VGCIAHDRVGYHERRTVRSASGRRDPVESMI
jgi:hypothetical protein